MIHFLPPDGLSVKMFFQFFTHTTRKGIDAQIWIPFFTNCFACLEISRCLRFCVSPCKSPEHNFFSMLAILVFVHRIGWKIAHFYRENLILQNSTSERVGEEELVPTSYILCQEYPGTEFFWNVCHFTDCAWVVFFWKIACLKHWRMQQGEEQEEEHFLSFSSVTFQKTIFGSVFNMMNFGF